VPDKEAGDEIKARGSWVQEGDHRCAPPPPIEGRTFVIIIFTMMYNRKKFVYV
jgi:hypothetical protein